MNAIVEHEVVDYLKNRLHYDPWDCGTILECMRSLARMAGHGLDNRFRHAGLGAGPEARVAAGIVDLAMMGGGCETTQYTIRKHITDWLLHNPRKGML
ncbi:MAG: hypothetical protein KAY37_05855 [Phycisphaerae bacterium]|nr:hypothetical protein [Phycisphaerae bacterium]